MPAGLGEIVALQCCWYGCLAALCPFFPSCACTDTRRPATIALLYCRSPKKCNCKKSKCLKLYCDCFANGGFCGPSCSCVNCANKVENRCGGGQQHSVECVGFGCAALRYNRAACWAGSRSRPPHHGPTARPPSWPHRPPPAPRPLCSELVRVQRESIKQRNPNAFVQKVSRLCLLISAVPVCAQAHSEPCLVPALRRLLSHALNCLRLGLAQVAPPSPPAWCCRLRRTRPWAGSTAVAATARRATA